MQRLNVAQKGLRLPKERVTEGARNQTLHFAFTVTNTSSFVTLASYTSIEALLSEACLKIGLTKALVGLPE